MRRNCQEAVERVHKGDWGGHCGRLLFLRRCTALGLSCLLLFLQTVPVLAERSVFFVAADETVLPLSDDTMPFWYGGYLYISSAIFTSSVGGGAAKENLEISLTQNRDQDIVTLYRDRDSLDYQMGEPYAVDPDGEVYYPGALWRNGRVFVPAYTVASYFGLKYSVIAVDHGSLVWLRHSSFRLQEQQLNLV